MHTEKCQYVLVSDALDSDQLREIESLAAASQGRWDVLTANEETDLDPATLDDIGIVFISVDVLGESSKTQLTPRMRQFCDIALRAPNLRWLQASSAGLDRPQFQTLLAQGVTFTHAGGIASTTVAHSAIAGLLALGRELPDFMAKQREQQWKARRGLDAPRDIPGQTAIVVGLGAIGQEIVRLCQALGLHVIGFNRSGASPGNLDIETHRLCDFDRLIEQADWLILSCPLTEDTRHLVTMRQLQRMKRSARLIDVSRGGVVASADLLLALQRGELAGAYLDVFETEPLPPDSPFWKLPNAIITPHAAGDSAGRGRKLTDFFIQNLGRYLAGQPLLNNAAGPG
ncbi:D-2-hydroxyacid dehydrogenase [Bordetella sp. 02P26C-1]|uniref:D-2-hydroxyacid dehydrogenase n=1 Tax=Bordetella sp. 02P26C-1 TaxID=2683195 RepID=UPI0013524CED|nr:D-2-hydroxyacid dehydrogenase [Bordetella sp. 02P26C-1]MVW78409.1 D-2-hydroxyacid dehydrogenase [Bordetella sp. 02P26C-1]